MKIDYRKIEFDTELDCGLVSKWKNDMSIRHLSHYFPDEDAFLEMTSPEDFKVRAKPIEKGRVRFDFIIEEDGLPIGTCDLEINPEQKTLPGKVAWIGLVIGEAHARGRGIGSQVMMHLEGLARGVGAEWVELGVFEFNTPARKLYQKLGYSEFLRIPDFTYWDGKMWSDIRLMKKL